MSIVTIHRLVQTEKHLFVEAFVEDDPAIGISFCSAFVSLDFDDDNLIENWPEHKIKSWLHEQEPDWQIVESMHDDYDPSDDLILNPSSPIYYF